MKGNYLEIIQIQVYNLVKSMSLAKDTKRYLLDSFCRNLCDVVSCAGISIYFRESQLCSKFVLSGTGGKQDKAKIESNVENMVKSEKQIVATDDVTFVKLYKDIFFFGFICVSNLKTPPDEIKLAILQEELKNFADIFVKPISAENYEEVGKLKELEKDYEEQKESLLSAENEIEKLKTELENEKAKLEEVGKKLYENNENEIKELNDLKETVKKRDKEISDYNQKNSELLSMISDIEQSVEENKNLSEELENCNKIKSKFEAQVEDLKKELENISTYEKEYDSLIENSPVALLFQDFTDSITFLKDTIIKEGEECLNNNPKLIIKALGLAKNYKISKKFLNIFELYDKADYISRQDKIYTESFLNEMGEMLIRFSNGENYYVLETELFTTKGFKKLLQMKAGFASSENDLSKIVLFFEDITESKEYKKRLEISESKYRSAVAESRDGVIIVENDGTISEWNRGIEEITGYSSDEILGKYLWDIQKRVSAIDDPDDKRINKIKDTVINVLNGDSDLEPRSLKDWEIVKKDGEKRVVQETFFRIGEENNYRICSIIRDITEIKLKEKEIYQHNLLLKSITDTVPLIIMINNVVTSELVYANLETENITGYTIEELMSFSSEDIQDIYHVEDRYIINSVIETLENDSFSDLHEFDFRIITKNNEIKWLHARLTPFKRNDEGKIEQILSVCQDITDKKNSEEELKKYSTRIDCLHNIEKELLSAGSVESIALVAFKNLKSIIDYNHASLIEYDFKEKIARVLAAETGNDTNREYDTGKEIPLDRLSKDTYENGKVRVCNNIENYDIDEELKNVLYDDGVRSFISIPLIANDKIMGEVNFSSEFKDYFTDELKDIAVQVADSMAVTMNQAILDKKKKKDAKTMEILLQEINHRVKNNLTSILGLLYTEMEMAGKSGSKSEFIGEMINRIRGLSTVHSMLSKTGWHSVRLDALLDKILKGVLTVSKRVDALYRIAETDMELTPKQAHALALVINELATNSLKHATNGRQKLKVGVIISGQLKMQFRDDGPGFPDEVINSKRYNVGLYLVQNIVKTELLGSIRLFNDRGAVVEISF